ncbi:MAG: rhodanese-like domain-containing protein [Spirochaetia bacterium]|nr:rhodanese-like domain-containing protein [Spirochaetia bacterium]
MHKEDAFEVLTTRFAVRFGADEISAAQIMERMAAGRPTLLIDVREAVEQNVSHIDGAILAGPRVDVAAMEAFQDFQQKFALDKDACIVFYCAGGYRSAQWASEFSLPAKTLHGGIVGWTKAGGKLVNTEGQPTLRLHAYNSAWAAYVDPPYQAVTQPPVR